MSGALLLAGMLVARDPLAGLDLTKTGTVAFYGRIQDERDVKVARRLVAAGPRAIPFLVGHIEDGTLAPRSVFEGWPETWVGDIALRFLCGLFLDDAYEPTVPGLEWNALLERRDPYLRDDILLAAFVEKHGRAEIRRRVERILAGYPDGFEWDENHDCFRPKLAGRHRTRR